LGSGTGQILAAVAGHRWAVINMATDWSAVHPRRGSFHEERPYSPDEASGPSRLLPIGCTSAVIICVPTQLLDRNPLLARWPLPEELRPHKPETAPGLP
jgi:hypothetical protein